ncbi:MAG: sialate O-acetylesterase [Planctomycetota bacterium]
MTLGNRLCRWFVVTACVIADLGAADAASDKPLLHPLFSDEAVLQRDKPVAVWGWAAPGATVSVALTGSGLAAKPSTVKTGTDGKWKTNIGPFVAGGPYVLAASSGSSTAEAKDVLVGDVWLCSGQSNMEWVVKQAANGTEEAAKANWPQIRHIKVPKNSTLKPQELFVGQWKAANPANTAAFTAVGYYMARQLHQELKIPIGLVHSSWGGTMAQEWTSLEVLTTLPEFTKQIAALQTPPPAPAAGPAKGPVRVGVTGLYNGMIAPLIPLTFTGAIWYQGESNAGSAMGYRTLLPAMITDWRTRFAQGDFPFLIVSLANYQDRLDKPADAPWAELREAQAMTVKKLPACGLALAIDIGDAKNIHPGNKQEVGRRLALNALALVYGQKIEWSGPWYRAMTSEGSAIRLQFDHLGGGLVTSDNAPITGFAIAGEDKQFVWAEAKIDGETIIVSAPTVTKPVAVRYAWASNPACNLANKAGLPAVPFRTDEWPRQVVPAKK